MQDQQKNVRNRITSFWQNQNVINKNQFCFLQDRSTTTHLLSTIHDFAKLRNSSFARDVIFLDLAKAFDSSVPHEHLLIKLYSLGIEGNLFNWLRHFLTCGKQRVVVRGTFSEWVPVASGMQGTILGPILFVSYINYIADCVSSKVKYIVWG